MKFEFTFKNEKMEGVVISQFESKRTISSYRKNGEDTYKTFDVLRIIVRVDTKDYILTFIDNPRFSDSQDLFKKYCIKDDEFLEVQELN